MADSVTLNVSALTPETVARSGIGIPIRVLDHSNRPDEGDATRYLGYKSLPHPQSSEIRTQVKRVRKRLDSGDFNGWGIVLSDQWCIIDIDVVDSKTGKIRKERNEAAIDFIKKWDLQGTVRVSRYSNKVSPIHGHYYLKIPESLVGDRVGGKVIHNGVVLGEMILPGVRYAAAPGYKREHPKFGITEYKVFQGKRPSSGKNLEVKYIPKKLWKSLRGQKDSEHLPISSGKKYPDEVLEALRLRCEEKIRGIKGAKIGRRRVYHLLPAWSDLASYDMALRSAGREVEADNEMERLEEFLWHYTEQAEKVTEKDLRGWHENYRTNMRTFRRRDFIRPEGLSEDVQELIRMQDDVTNFWDRQPAYKSLKNIALRERTDPFAVLLAGLMAEASSVDHRVRVQTCQKVKTLRPVPMTIFTVMVGGTGRGKTSTAEVIQRARKRRPTSASAVMRSITDGGVLLLDNQVLPRTRANFIDLVHSGSEKLSPTTRNGVLDGFTESGPLLQNYKDKNGEKKSIMFMGVKRQKCHRAHIWIDEARTYLPGEGGRGISENSDRLISFLNSAFLGGDLGHDTGRDRFKILSGQYTITALLGIQDDVLENFEQTYSSGFFGRCSIVCMSHDPLESEKAHERAYNEAIKFKGYQSMEADERAQVVRDTFDKMYPSPLPRALNLIHPGWDGSMEIERVQRAIDNRYSQKIGSLRSSTSDTYGVPLHEKSGHILSSAMCPPEDIVDPLIIFTLGESVSEEMMRVATVSLMDQTHEGGLSQDHADILREWQHMKRINFEDSGEQSLLSDMVSHGLMRMEILAASLAIMCAPQDKKFQKKIEKSLRRAEKFPDDDVIIEIPDNYWDDVKVFCRFLGLKYRTHRAQQRRRAEMHQNNRNWRLGEEDAYREHSKNVKMEQLENKVSVDSLNSMIDTHIKAQWKKNGIVEMVDGERKYLYPAKVISNNFKAWSKRWGIIKNVEPPTWSVYKTSEEFTNAYELIKVKVRNDKRPNEYIVIPRDD